MMPGPDIRTLLELFRDHHAIRAYEHIKAAEMPPPFDQLLVHEHHMTVTVEAFHRSLVDVRVVASRLEGDDYARMSLLALQTTGRIVQLGMVRIHLHFCTQTVREEILAGQIPLGRILLNHGILTAVKPTAFLRLLPGPALCEWFGLARAEPIYGRLAVITCDEQPAIEVLEIEAPEPPAPDATAFLQ